MSLTRWRTFVRNFSGGKAAIPQHATVTLTNAQIKLLPTVPIVIVPATETPNYATNLTSIPVLIGGFIILSNYGVAYTGVDADAAFSFFLGSDSAMDVGGSNMVSRTLLRGNAAIAGGDGFAYVNPGRNAISSPSEGLFLETMVASAFEGNFYDNAIVFGLDNNAGGNLGGGHADNTIKVTLVYTVLDL